jgi:hypothetical protein
MDNTTVETKNTLEDALQTGVSLCWTTLDADNLDEHGGVILHHTDSDAYKFVLLTNDNAGTELGPVLFTANRDEHMQSVIATFSKGWLPYASFHTHPQFPPWPSFIDMNELFPGFQTNYIFSGLTNEIMKYTWIDPKNLNGGLLPEHIELNNGK